MDYIKPQRLKECTGRVMRKTKPRRLFYLLAITTICILGLFYNKAWLTMLDAC